MRRAIPFGLALAAATAAVAAASASWHRLPAAPLRTPSEAVGVWSGKELLVFARTQPKPPWSVDVAARYDPATRSWRTLSPLPGPKGNYEGRYQALWTGKEMVVLGPFDAQAYAPAANRWRRLRQGGGPNALVAWTGREVLAWGGGCCGDASAAGSRLDPAANRWRPMAAAPLAPSQGPQGAWDGRELVVLVSGLDPDGRPYPARKVRAAAYDPTANRWRRIAQPPSTRSGATGVWDGSEVLFVGGTIPGNARPTRVGLAYDPAANRWRTLPAMPAGRIEAAVVRAGGRVLVWGGSTALPTGYQYVPAAGRWFTIGSAPVRGRRDPVAAWTGTTLLLWGGRGARDGASWTP